jgi:hypothetical protein
MTNQSLEMNKEVRSQKSGDRIPSPLQKTMNYKGSMKTKNFFSKAGGRDNFKF